MSVISGRADSASLHGEDALLVRLADGSGRRQRSVLEVSLQRRDRAGLEQQPTR